MERIEINQIKQYLLDRIPIKLDIEKQDLKYDTRDIHYQIYKYIKELENGSDKE